MQWHCLSDLRKSVGARLSPGCEPGSQIGRLRASCRDIVRGSRTSTLCLLLLFMATIHRDYISHGMRERTAELVTIELGPQSEHEVRRKLAGEVGADRWTRLDATLRREALRTEDGVLD
jgi:hypothetical protein